MSYKMFINGEFVDSSNKETYEIHNPANGSNVGTVARGTIEDAKAAIDSAYEAVDREKKQPTNIPTILLTTSALV
ncbi:MAG: aldehyde dehydrogenase family protein, partial [Nitrososphaerota archaeon]|nr:aldehyde dehydrogenase family protein [Nitrososphaerota archaeon]